MTSRVPDVGLDADPTTVPVTSIASWSNVRPGRTRLVDWRADLLRHVAPDQPCIARGAGRSFGDAAYVTGGLTASLLQRRRLQPVDTARSRVTCDAGVAMIDLQRHVEQAGFRFPVYGGTQWATTGGAAASDIHGKNDVVDGSFGSHVESLVINTVDAGTLECSRQQHADLFSATLGGMGQTGVIESLTLRLRRDPCRSVRVQARHVGSVDEMLACFRELDAEFQVCDWMGLSARAPRGLFWYASRADQDSPEPGPGSDCWLPRIKLFNRWSVETMERLLLRRAHDLDVVRHIRAFNYGGGHERLKNWNRLYGRHGFIEYHFVLPEQKLTEGFHALLGMSARRSTELYFGVVKRFGDHRRAGLLSFPMAGYGMNFQMENTTTSRRLLSEFTDLLLSLGGRVYLAKDAVITEAQFAPMYPKLDEWRKIVGSYDSRHVLRSDLSTRLQLKPW
jgi:FAD/FMN-containing dehydrogenase